MDSGERPAMRIRYTLTPDDLIAWNMQCYERRTKAILRRSRTAPVFLGILALALGVVTYRSGYVISTLLIPIGATILMITLLSDRLTRNATLQATRKLYAQGNHSGAFGPRELELTDPFLQEHSQVGSGWFWLTSLHSIEETGEHVFILINDLRAIVIPRRDVSSEALAAFLSELHNLAPHLSARHSRA